MPLSVGSMRENRQNDLDIKEADVKVIVCGGRDLLTGIFCLLPSTGSTTNYQRPGIHCIVSGCAPGADTFALEWSKKWVFGLRLFPADWKRHGRAAGPIRNQEMLDAGPDLVIAFPGGRGTADMVRRAKSSRSPCNRDRDRRPSACLS